jgi:hypothetical protein
MIVTILFQNTSLATESVNEPFVIIVLMVQATCQHSMLATDRVSAEACTNHVYCGLQVTGGRLGGVVVSVLATGPKGLGFKPGRGDGF